GCNVTRRVWMAAVTGLAGLVLAGCGSAQTAATAEQLPSVPGLNLSEDGLEIRNLQVPYAPEGYSTGGDVPVLMTIFNDSDQPVRLLDVDSSLGASANVVDVSAVRYPALPGQPQPEQPAPGQTVDVAFGPGEFAHITMRVNQISAPVDPAGGVPIELRFDNGVTVTVIAPIVPPLEPAERAEPENIGHH